MCTMIFGVRYVFCGRPAIPGLVLSGMLAFAVCSETASAQYVPPPPISPWVMMNNRSNSPVSNFFNYVQPQIQMGQALQTQGVQLRQTQSATMQLEKQLSSGEIKLRAPGAAGPSTGARGCAGFRQMSPWYSGISNDPTPRETRKFR